MPSPRIFVSSTCYDLAVTRERVRAFILQLGFEAVLSEYSDVLYDPRLHTHVSCVREIANADMVVLIIGSRFGGNIVPQALSSIDLEKLLGSSLDVSLINSPERLSVTQLEVLKAVEQSIPVFVFVQEGVMHDYYVYIKNKEISNQINFPSIENKESAPFIFEFISFLDKRSVGNSVVTFARLEDVETHLVKQWSSLFQRLLREQRESLEEGRRLLNLSEQLEDLKSALISSIDVPRNREIARGVIRYRRLIDFLQGLPFPQPSIITTFEGSFLQLLDQAGIDQIITLPDRARGVSLGRTAFNHKSREYFIEARFSRNMIDKLSIDWESFVNLDPASRSVIVDAVTGNERLGFGMTRRIDEPLEKYLEDDSATEAQDPLLSALLMPLADTSENTR